jgi:hypothetical protein
MVEANPFSSQEDERVLKDELVFSFTSNLWNGIL